MEENYVNPPTQPVQQSTQTQYVPPVQQLAPSTEIGLGDWLITMLLLAIPVLNIIMLFVWGFGGGTPPSKANFAKAALIWMVIGVILSLMFMSSLAALFAGFR